MEIRLSRTESHPRQGAARRRNGAAWATAALAAVRAVAGHLTLPLMLVVRGTPFLGLLLIRPNEPAVALGAAQARSGTIAWPALLAAATLGALTADVVSYALGRTWGEPAIERLHRRGRHGFVARVTARAQRAVQRNAPLAVVLARPTVVTHGTVPVLAGVAGTPLRVFLPAATVGAALWAGLWSIGGAAVAAAVSRQVVVGSAAVLAVGLAVWLIWCVLRAGCHRPLPAP